METRLDYSEIRYRLDVNVVFRILRKDSAAFMLGFFQEQFKRRHRADIGQSELSSELSAYIEFVRMSGDGDTPGRDSGAYLDEWANEGFLRKYYPAEASEACYDLTPDSERALEWVGELSHRPFIGTESRLLALFETLRDIAYGAAFNAEEQRAELLRRRAGIDAELERLERGESLAFDDTRILERYYGIEDSARRLMADFKQIEQNFRDLDRETKERVIASDGARGSVLKEVFEHRDAIVTSDQGKSFSTFWAYLMLLDRREELSGLIQRVLELPAVQAANKSFPLESLNTRLVEAGTRVQRMTYRLNEELRYFLDERSRREGKRVAELIEAFKRLALEHRDSPPDKKRFLEIEGDPELNLAMDRPLYEPEAPVFIAEHPMAAGAPSADVEALFDGDRIDLGELADRIQAILYDKPQATLSAITTKFPVRQGAAELLGYLSIAAGSAEAALTGEGREKIMAQNSNHRSSFVIDAPETTFLRGIPS